MATTRKLGLSPSIWKTESAPDYIALVLLLSGYFLVQFFIEPFHRLFTISNIALQYPHALIERVPVPWLFLYAMGVPVTVMIAWAAAWQPGVYKTKVTFLGLFVSLLLTSFLTDIIKNAVGRPRPDLIDRCQPKPDTPEHILVGIEVCTQTEHHTLHDGWRSFPSGHSSFAFSGLGYLSLFICGQLRVFRPGSDMLGALLALLPMIGAAMIAISRCEDYRHDVYDVTVGSILGMTIAWLSYRRFYPRLSAVRCDTPTKKEEGRKYRSDPADDDAATPLQPRTPDLESGLV